MTHRHGSIWLTHSCEMAVKLLGSCLKMMALSPLYNTYSGVRYKYASNASISKTIPLCNATLGETKTPHHATRVRREEYENTDASQAHL